MNTSQQRMGFREFIPPQDVQRSKELATSDTYGWAKLRCSDTFMIGWMENWRTLYEEPYKGITVTGEVIPNLYHLAKKTSPSSAPTEAMTKSAHRLLSLTSPEVRKSLIKSLDAPEWRAWANPEIYISRHGIRLEEVADDLVSAIYDLMRSSLSSTGYAKARGCMKVNQFLGEIVNGTKVLNEKSYNFCMFGTPSTSEPWGWQMFGHHFCMNCLVIEGQIVISPVFMGAEPNVIDEGPDKGTELFTDQEQLVLKLMRSMDDATFKRVRIFEQLSGPEYPPGRFHRADQRHLGGAFQDNRIIPYEGAKVSTLSEAQQDMVRGLLTLSLNYLPDGALEAYMAQIAEHWKDDTYFCWIGGLGEKDAFYYKVHSPVVMIEFDHHSGVFLNNKTALPFHIHTLVRAPNGNDYGKALLEQYFRKKRAKSIKFDGGA